MNKRSGIESRKRIITAAVDIFSKHGYTKASMREIAHGAGISVGGVYLYFKNKEELYMSLMKEMMLNLKNQAQKTIQPSTSPATALSALLKLHLDFAKKYKGLILFHIREHGFTFGSEIKRQFLKSQRRLFEDIIKKGIYAGEFRKCNAREMATLIMGALRGITLSIALDDMHIAFKGLDEFILKSLSVQENQP